MLATVHWLRDDVKGYEAEKKRVFDANPGYAEFFHIIARSAVREHRYKQAIELEKQAIKVDPQYFEAMEAAGTGHLRLGEEKQGLEWLEKSWEGDQYNARTKNILDLWDHTIPNQYSFVRSKNFKFRFPNDEKDILRRYIEPLLDPALEHLESIRIGTKATVFWPERVLSDEDADDLMRLFEEVRAAGKHLALMSHYSHPCELEPEPAKRAVQRIQDAGAVVRSQAPVLRHINDDAEVWARMWQEQTRMGIVPYYMLVARDTGPQNYFEVPLAKAVTIYNDAIRQVSGLARTVRGPSMSATPGKVLVEDVVELNGEKLFALKLIQAREPSAVGRLFFAKYNPRATWYTELEPAGGPWPT